jgi:Zn-dependent protease with chaperone function
MPTRPDAFIHPEDRAALENLRSISLFPAAVGAFMKVMPERLLHGINMADKVRLGPEQLPELYGRLPPICAALGIAEPELYLEMDSVPNAYTYGDTQVFLTITSGLVEHMEEDEFEAMLAHECGHIACRHVLYHTMTDMLLTHGATVFGPLAAASHAIRLGLLYWYRRSELSADRAAAVVMKGASSVVEMLIRLAGGPKSLTAGLDVDAYIRQAESYDALLDGQWDGLLQNMAVMNRSHPFLAVRTRELVRWCQGEEFRALVQAIEAWETTPRCPRCGQPIQRHWKCCGHCGQPLLTADTHDSPTTGPKEVQHG